MTSRDTQDTLMTTSLARRTLTGQANEISRCLLRAQRLDPPQATCLSTRAPAPRTGCRERRQHHSTISRSPRPVLPPTNERRYLSRSFKAQAPQLQAVNHLPVPRTHPRSNCASRAGVATRSFATMAEPLSSRSGDVKILADALEKPLLDTREYRVVKLPNDLEALLIHDPDTDKAAAAMDVNVGSFSDPEDMPGMAHAVEHLLFMGTEKVCIARQCCRRGCRTNVGSLSSQERMTTTPT